MAYQGGTQVQRVTLGSARAERAALERAVTHVNALWFPVNPELHSRIVAGLENGTYDLDLDFLLQDLKCDLSLFSYTVRELATSRPRGSARVSIRELFQEAGNERLKKILSTPASVISRHSTSGVSRSQSDCLSNAVVSATSTEMMADRVGFDPYDGFSSALLRQLGTLLISFNYPSIFRKAVIAISKGEQATLDEQLSKLLGFSPLLLASAVLESWEGISTTVIDSAISKPQPAIEGRSSGNALSLLRLVQIGEQISRANCPELYPEVTTNWIGLRDETVEILGSDALRVLGGKIKEAQSAYSGWLGGVREFAPEAHIVAFNRRTFENANPSVANCLPPLRSALADLYHAQGSDNNPANLIKLFVQRVLPVSGFAGGAILTLDPGIDSLVVRHRFGKIVMRSMDVVSVGLSNRRDPIAQAFRSIAPALETSAVEEGELVGNIIGRLGGQQPLGVLYLEYQSELFTALGGSGPLVHYKAIRKALEDIFGIKS